MITAEETKKITYLAYQERLNREAEERKKAEKNFIYDVINKIKAAAYQGYFNVVVWENDPLNKFDEETVIKLLKPLNEQGFITQIKYDNIMRLTEKDEVENISISWEE